VSYKLLAVDVDGTLVRRDGSVHPDDLDAIDRLQRGGVPVSIVTGRLYSGTRAIARQVRIGGPIACADGSHIVDARDDAELYHRGITGDHAVMVRDILGSRDTASFLFAQDSIVHDPSGAAFAQYVSTWSSNIDIIDRVTDHAFWEHERGITAVVSLGTEADIRSAAEEIRARLPDVAFVATFPVLRVAMFAMIIRAAGPTKGTAVEWLARHHGCTAAEVVVVGDWLNDVPMFRTAGRSFVMGQAPPSVKDAATDRLEADGHDGGGIAEAVRLAWGA
jgi:hypothetical protein